MEGKISLLKTHSLNCSNFPFHRPESGEQSIKTFEFFLSRLGKFVNFFLEILVFFFLTNADISFYTIVCMKIDFNVPVLITTWVACLSIL